ncbi:MAG: hypothetical protein KJO65_09070, partial [Gemmatimonadetes bacterium]|nr:hypothetical protein [Gemmatimonadota bacterium]
AYDIAVADPPYGSAKLDRVLAAWQSTPFAEILAFEHAKDHLVDGKGKMYDFGGSTRITIIRR